MGENEVGVLVLAVMAALLAVGGLALRRGHGAWMIAGYNAATPEERARYDKRALCCAVGTFMLRLAALMLVPALTIACTSDAECIACATFVLLAGLVIALVLLFRGLRYCRHGA